LCRLLHIRCGNERVDRISKSIDHIIGMVSGHFDDVPRVLGIVEPKGAWVVVSFDPSTNKEQRDALAPMILKTYGLEWGEVKVQEAPIEINRTGDIVSASLGGGQYASMKLQREGGADGKGVVLRNVKYFGAQNNDGFEMYR